MVRQTSELPAQRRCEVLFLDTKRLSGRSGYQDSGRVKGKALCLAHKFCLVPLEGVSGTEYPFCTVEACF